MLGTRLHLKNRGIFIRIASKSDYGRVLKFLQEHFYPFDQSSHGRVSNRQSREDEENELKSIDSGASVLAFTDDDRQELIGVSLARKFREEECRESLKMLKALSGQRGYPNDLDGVIFTEEMKLRSKICRRYNIEEALYLALTCVRRDFQGYSLAKLFMQKRLHCGRELGLKVAFGLAVTPGGIKLTEAFNFEHIYVLKFVNYRDYRGLSVYNSFPPEAVAKIAVKQIDKI